MSERLFKYHGLGNDFVVLDRRQSGRDIDADTSRRLCDRRRGLGADGVLALLPDDRAWARMVVHNSDGSIAEMCGNGIRCVVKHLADFSHERPARVPVMTGAGLLECAVTYSDGRASEVEVAMGPARLVDRNLPSAGGQPFVRAEVSGFPGVVGTAISMGNPHLVLFDRPLAEAESLGPKLELAPGFPDRTNVEVAQQHGPALDVVVWERGCGLTQACGTGACASVAAGIVEGRLPADTWVPVKLPGGELLIRVAADLSAVTMRGPVTFVFEAQVGSLDEVGRA